MTKAQRKTFILDKLATAMRAIKNDPRYDWGPAELYFGPADPLPENPAFSAAETLMKAVQKFVDGKIEESAIKELYKAYVGTYTR